MKSSLIKKALQNTCLLLGGCVVALLILEITLRYVYPIEQRIKGDRISLPVNKDYSAENKDISRVDSFIYHRKNSMGFRGENLPENSNNYLTIVTIGGSTTECNYISDGKTWTDVLGNLLKQKFSNVWWNNAGLDGHSTFGHIVIMQDYITKIKPKIVIFLAGINDQGIDYISKHDLENIRDGLNFRSFKSFIKSTAHYSEVASLFLNIHRYIRAVRAKYTDREVNYKEELEKMRPIDDNDFLTEKLKHEQRYLPGYALRIRRLIAISKENNIIPVFVTQPALYGNFKDEITGLSFKRTNAKWKILELYNDVIREIGVTENVLVIDLAKKMPKSTRYYYDWIHFTNEGSVKVGEIINSELSFLLTYKFPKFRIANNQ